MQATDIGALALVLAVVLGLLKLLERLIEKVIEVRRNNRIGETANNPRAQTGAVLTRQREAVDLLQQISTTLTKMSINMNGQIDDVAAMRPKIDELYDWHAVEDAQGRKVWRCQVAELVQPVQELTEALKRRPCIMSKDGQRSE